MKESSQPNRLTAIIKNPHFWLILGITLFLIRFYSIWPWREWEFSHSIWSWTPWLSSFYYLAAFESFNHVIGSLFLIPIVYATIIYRWQGALIVFLLSLIGVIPLMHYYRNATGAVLTNIIIFLLPALVTLAVNVELKLRRRDKIAYVEREKERQAYLAKIIEAQERERQRLAEELHDQSVQTLLAVASYAESIELSDDNINEIKDKAAFIKEKTRTTVDDLRRISVDLRPSILDDMGLNAALRWLTSRTNDTKRIRVYTSLKGIKPDLNPVVEVNVFRIVQEALNNIERHSKASEAHVTLDARAGSLVVSIKDNGQGFFVPDKLADLVTQGKLGIIGMQERVKSLGGSFKITSKSDEGTLVLIEVPYQISTIPQLQENERLGT